MAHSKVRTPVSPSLLDELSEQEVVLSEFEEDELQDSQAASI